MSPDALAFNQSVIDDHRANEGVQTMGPLAGARLLILTTTGAQTGLKRTKPLGHIKDGDDYIVVGSNSGQEANPAWLTNITKDPRVTVEVGTETFDAVAEITEGAERRRLFDAVIAAIPPFAEYEKTVKTREIPIIRLKRVK
jgi:deazaflavin-dependent oxidoreductase (nitroreductase family)